MKNTNNNPTPLQILYEDNHVIVVFKPAGVLSQSETKEDDSLFEQVKTFIKKRDNKPGNVFLGIIHRIDRNVAGIIVFAKTSKGASRLSAQLRSRTFDKTYYALVEGRVKKSDGTLINYLAKDENAIKAMVTDKMHPDAKESKLRYNVIIAGSEISLVEIHLETGRFHQIRAQFANIGHPLAGDNKYGSKIKLGKSEIALCAVKVVFQHATTQKKIEVSIPYPKSWDKLLK